MAAITIYLTSGTKWVVPNNWNNSNNKIECIGGGGSGAVGASGTGGGSGGGGGAYALISNSALTAGATVTYAIGDRKSTRLNSSHT
mgnify:CR=1 FL=1